MPLPTENQTIPASRKLVLAYLLGILAVIGFGGTLPITKIAVGGFNPDFLTFARALIASILAIGTLLIFKKKLYHPQNLQIFIAGVLLIFGFPFLMAIAMQTVPSSHGGVVLGFLPVTTALIARLITDEKPSRLFWGLSFLGCAIVVLFIYTHSDETGDIGISKGDFLLIAAGVSASFGYVIFGKLSKTTAGWEITSRALLLNLPLIVAGFIWTFKPQYMNASTTELLALLYLGTISMLFAFFAWNVALAWGGIAKIGQLQLLQTFATIILSALLLDEAIGLLTWLTALAITLIIAASRKL